MNKSKSFQFMIFLTIFIFLVLSSCKEINNVNEQSKKDIELKEKELALKEKDIKLKEEDLLRKREENIEKKENELSKEKNTYVNIEGKYDGSIKDGTYWVVYINNFNGSNFIGYNVIYWQKSPEGMRTNFSGEFNSSDNTITIYEDRNAKGSGTFYGKVSSDEKTISGTWYRYSDGGSFTWNLTKVN